MKRRVSCITRSKLIQFVSIVGLACLTGCISYGSALVGSEAPFVPIPVLDTVATTATGVYGMVGWPLVYNVNDRNQLVGAGVYQTRSLPAPSTSNLRGWSFVYGGAAYMGRYQVDSIGTVAPEQEQYTYHGGLLHGAARWQLWSDDRVDFTLEPALSIFYEGGDYFHFRQRANREPQSIVDTHPVSATLHFSQILRYRLNDYWDITGVYTSSLPLDNVFSQYTFSGTLAVSRRRLTLWARPGVHINISSLSGLTDWSTAAGLGYRLSNL